jgi:hypothetical protein
VTVVAGKATCIVGGHEGAASPSPASMFAVAGGVYASASTLASEASEALLCSASFDVASKLASTTSASLLAPLHPMVVAMSVVRARVEAAPTWRGTCISSLIDFPVSHSMRNARIYGVPESSCRLAELSTVSSELLGHVAAAPDG